MLFFIDKSGAKKISKKILRETREAITPVDDTVKLCTSNIPLRGHRDSAKNGPEVGKSDLTNSGNHVELL